MRALLILLRCLGGRKEAEYRISGKLQAPSSDIEALRFHIGANCNHSSAQSVSVFGLVGLSFSGAWARPELSVKTVTTDLSSARR